MTVEWYEATEDVLEMARSLIARHHEHLLEARIAFIFRSEAQMSGGKRILARPQRCRTKCRPWPNTIF